VVDLGANLSPTPVVTDLEKNDIGTVKYNIRGAKQENQDNFLAAWRGILIS